MESQAAAPIFDRAFALALADGDEDLMIELVNLFLHEGVRQLSAVRVALDARDAEQLWRSAHTLAGSLGSLGAGQVAEAAHRVEQVGRAGRIQEAAAEFAVLDAFMTLLMAELTEMAAHGSSALQKGGGGAN